MRTISGEVVQGCSPPSPRNTPSMGSQRQGDNTAAVGVVHLHLSRTPWSPRHNVPRPLAKGPSQPGEK